MGRLQSGISSHSVIVKDGSMIVFGGTIGINTTIKDLHVMPVF